MMMMMMIAMMMIKQKERKLENYLMPNHRHDPLVFLRILEASCLFFKRNNFEWKNLNSNNKTISQI